MLDALRQPLETRRDRDRARQPPHRLPLAHPARRRHEPVQMRRRQARARAASAGRAAPPTIRRASPGRCSTASTCRSRCRPSPPPISCCRRPTEGSAEVRARVTAARERQRARFAALGARRACAPTRNAPGKLLEQIAMPDEAGLALLRQASETLRLSARGFHRTLARGAHAGRSRRGGQGRAPARGRGAWLSRRDAAAEKAAMGKVQNGNGSGNRQCGSRAR